jgi:hypothetical protein
MESVFTRIPIKIPRVKWSQLTNRFTNWRNRCHLEGLWSVESVFCPICSTIWIDWRCLRDDLLDFRWLVSRIQGLAFEQRSSLPQPINKWWNFCNIIKIVRSLSSESPKKVYYHLNSRPTWACCCLPLGIRCHVAVGFSNIANRVESPFYFFLTPETTAINIEAAV